MVTFNTKRIILYNIIFSLVFSGFVFYHNEQANNSSVNVYYYPKIEIPCIDILKADALYDGQPLCGQPPLTYYIGYLFSSIFGEPNIHIVTFFLMLLLSATICTMLTIYLHLDGFKEFLILCSFSSFFLLIGIKNFPAILSTFFIFSAFFKFRQHKIFTSSLLFALALLSKITVLIFLPIFALLVINTHTHTTE